MANLFDYLTWRADVPFSADPFNEVDNLVLAELSYADLGDALSTKRKNTLAEVQKEFFRINDREELEKFDWFTASSPFLLDKMADGARFRDTVVSDFINIIDLDQDEQMSAVTFKLSDGTIYAAFRGTDATVVGWKEDFNLSYMYETAGQKRAAEYLTEIGKKYRGKLRVGGHSKGGNFAVYAAAFCDPKVQKRIIEVWSNDGPGFREGVVEKPEFQRIFPRIKSIVPEYSMIGMLLTTGYNHKAIKSDSTGIMQHDGFTWQLERNVFEEVELSDLSKYCEETMSTWIGKMDDDTRMSITNTIFSLIESTGMATFSEISKQKWDSFKSISTAMSKLPKDKQHELFTQVAELIQTGQTAALARIPFISERMK